MLAIPDGSDCFRTLRASTLCTKFGTALQFRPDPINHLHVELEQLRASSLCSGPECINSPIGAVNEC